MDNLRYLLAAILGLTLIMSVVSGVNPSYFAGMNAFADEHDTEDDNSGSSNDDNEEHDDDNNGRGEHDRERKEEHKLKVEDDGVEVEVEVEGLNMTDGSYDAIFACEEPDFNMTLNDAFDVEDGEGKLEEMIGLGNGTYTGCEITVEGNVLASFRTFTVSEDSDNEQEHRIEEKRKEKEERIVTTINGTTIHERHRSQNAASPGEYDPGWDYNLLAAGTANETNATVDIDLGVWKSNSAVILLDVIGGTVEIENQTYTVVLGYALHSISHDTIRVGALAVDDGGNVYKLKMRGSAVNDEAEFPTESGSIELTFDGSSSNRFGNWELTVDGTITAS